MNFNITIEKAGQFNSSLLPDDAHALRWLYEASGKWSDPSVNEISKREIIPRIFGLAVLPMALLYSAYFAARGFFQSGAYLFTYRASEAGSVLLEDASSASKCLVLTITNIAYAVLGLIFGHVIYKKFIPTPREIDSKKELVESRHTLLRQLQDTQKDLKELRQQLDSLKTLKENLENDCSQESKQLDAYHKEIALQKNQVSIYTKQINELEQQLSYSNEKKALSQTIAMQNLQLHAQAKDMEIQQQILKEAQTRIESLTKANVELNTQYTQWKATRTTIEDQNEVLKNEKISLQGSLEEQQGNLEQKNQEIALLKKELEEIIEDSKFKECVQEANADLKHTASDQRGWKQFGIDLVNKTANYLYQ